MIQEVPNETPFAWIQEGLRSPVGHPPEGDTAVRVADLVPPRFEAYAKVFHPIFEDPSASGEGVTWADVENASPPSTGKSRTEQILRDSSTLLRVEVGDEPPRAWRRVPWAEIAGQLGLPYSARLNVSDLDRTWPGGSWPARLRGPDEGNLTVGVVAALARALQRDGGPGLCYFWWWMLACMGALKPERNRLFHGELSDLQRFLMDKGLPSPTYWWPEGRTWCVATDWDLCFTVLGGSRSLVEQVLATREVEGLAVQPEDALLNLIKTDGRKSRL